MSIDFRGRLGGVRPLDTNNWNLIANVMEGQRYYVSHIIVCNMTGGALTFRIYASQGVGSSDSEVYAQYYDKNIAANDTIIAELGIYINVGETLVVRASAGDSITFTAHGYLEDISSKGAEG